MKIYALMKIYSMMNQVINMPRCNRAVSIDQIINEILKYDDIKKALVSFFNCCFSLGIVPSLWLKSIIVPVPNSSNKDPNVPLNYIGINLHSCIYNIYSGIINTRIVKYLDDLDRFVNEQAGFRKGRSCQDQMFSLTSIIHNREAQHLSTFADMQKAFDWVDRDLLVLKLFINNIDGKSV